MKYIIFNSYKIVILLLFLNSKIQNKFSIKKKIKWMGVFLLLQLINKKKVVGIKLQTLEALV